MKIKNNFKKLTLILIVILILSSFAFAKNFEIYNSTNTAQNYFLVNGTTGYVGIGVSSPTSILEIANNNWISARNYLGTATINMFKINSDNNIEAGNILNMGTYKITNLANGTSGQDAVTKSQLDAVQGSISDTWWGLNEGYIYNNSNNLDFNETLLNATIQDLVDTSVTDVWVNTSGDTMSGNLNMNANNITNVKQLTFDSNKINIGDSTTISSGDSSIAIGGTSGVGVLNGPSATGASSIAIGGASGNDAFGPTASGLLSIAIGEGANASGNYAIVIGTYASASTTDSLALLYGSNASGASSIAIGATSVASGAYSITIGGYDGGQSIASATNAIAIGAKTTASATNAIALGANTNNAVANSFKVGGSVTHTFLNTTLNISGTTDIHGTLDMNENLISNLANGTSGQDAVTLSQLQAVNSTISDTNTWWDISTSEYLENRSGILDINESKLNATIELLDTDTWWGLNEGYIYNNSNNLDFNETLLNATIETIGNTNYVPYTNATSDVDLGTYDLSVRQITASSQIKADNFYAYARDLGRNNFFYGIGYDGDDITIDNYANIITDGYITSAGTIQGESLYSSDYVVGNAVNKFTNTYSNGGVDLQFYGGKSLAIGEFQTASIQAKQEQQWTGTASTQDSSIIFSTANDGVVSENVKINKYGGIEVGCTDADWTESVLINGNYPTFALTSDSGVNTGIGMSFNSVALEGEIWGWGANAMTWDVDGHVTFPVDITTSDIYAPTTQNLNFYIDPNEHYVFKYYNAIATEYRDILDLSVSGADFHTFDITTTGNIEANELTLTDDVNAVNGIFTGDINVTSGIYSYGTLDMNENLISNLANGTSGQDAVTKSQLDAVSATISDTDTWWGLNEGYIYNNSNNLDFNETLLNQTIDARAPTVTDVWVNTSGDTMSGNLNMGDSYKITNLANGTSPQDAVTLSQILDINGTVTSTYIPYTGAISNVNLGNYNLTTNNIQTTTLKLENDNWISANNSAGTGTINMFKVNSNNQIEVGAPLNIGSFEFSEDSGLVSFVDMPVTSAASDGTDEGYVFKVDGQNILTVFSESDGAGGIDNKRVGIGTTTPTDTLHVVGTANITGNIYSNGVLLQDTDTSWNITGSNYLINSTNILEINETKLNETIELVGDANYVPYTGATSDVNLGSHDLNATNITTSNQLSSKVSYERNDDALIIYNPFAYYHEGTTSGELKIHLPFIPTGSDTNNVIIEAEVGTGSSVLLNAKFIFTATATATGWKNITTRTTQTSDFELATGFDDPGLGTEANELTIGCGNSFLSLSSFTNLRFVITKLIITGDNIDEDWITGWTSELITTPFTPITHQQGYLVKEWNSYNDGAGSGLDADKFGGYAYQNYVYGTSTNGMKGLTPTTGDYNAPDDRVQFLYGNNIVNAPGPFSAGNPYSSVMNVPIAGAGYNWQLGMTSNEDRLYFRREYAGWKPWIEFVSTNHVGNLNFTGDVNITGELQISNSSEVVFKVDDTGEVFSDGGYSTPAADLAEKIPTSDKTLKPGDVVIIDINKEETLTKSNKAYDKLVAGIVSTKPGIKLGDNLDSNSEYIALVGRVPVNVIGDVKVGDLLTTSNVPGKAMTCNDITKCFGAILGKAMTNQNGGQVIALVTLQ